MTELLKLYWLGAYAYRLGIPAHENPYPLTSLDRADWRNGWDDAASGGVQDGWIPEGPLVTTEMLDAGYDATRGPDGTPKFAEAGFTLGWVGLIYRAMAAAAKKQVAS